MKESLRNLLLNANTPSEKGKATRMLNAYIKERESQGYNPVMVRAGVQSWLTRMQKTTSERKGRKTSISQSKVS